MHKDYQANNSALRFFRFRRQLEDIHVFLESVLLDALSQEDIDLSLYHLRQESEMLHTMG